MILNDVLDLLKFLIFGISHYLSFRYLGTHGSTCCALGQPDCSGVWHHLPNFDESKNKILICITKQSANFTNFVISKYNFTYNTHTVNPM